MTKFKLFRKKDIRKIKKALISILVFLVIIFYIWFLIFKHGK